MPAANAWLVHCVHMNGQLDATAGTRLPGPAAPATAPYGAHPEKDGAKLLCLVCLPPCADAQAVWYHHAAGQGVQGISATVAAAVHAFCKVCMG